MKRSNLTSARGYMLPILAALVFYGCSPSVQVDNRQVPATASSPAAFGKQRRLDLREIMPEQAMSFLSDLNLGVASAVPNCNTIVVRGSAGEVYRATIVLSLVDTREQYLIETLAPVSNARSIPTNRQIAEALGRIVIGTFANPPEAGEHMRAIVDIHEEAVVAIIPTRVQRDLLAFIASGPAGLRQVRGEAEPASPVEPTADSSTLEPADQPQTSADVFLTADTAQEPTTETPNAIVIPPGPAVPEQAGGDADLPATADAEVRDTGQEMRGKIVPKSVAGPTRTKSLYEPAPLANGDDVVQLNLPERLELTVPDGSTIILGGMLKLNQNKGGSKVRSAIFLKGPRPSWTAYETRRAGPQVRCLRDVLFISQAGRLLPDSDAVLPLSLTDPEDIAQVLPQTVDIVDHIIGCCRPPGPGCIAVPGVILFL